MTLSRREAVTAALLAGIDLMNAAPQAEDSALDRRLAKARPFRVAVPQAEFDRIVARLREARLPRLAAGTGWQYGVEADWFREFIADWTTRYDWRARETALNRWRHAMATVAGRDLHFVFEPGSGRSPRPIMLLHGWPYSFASLLPVAERLAHPERFGGDAERGLDVIVPSLPGFVFSAPPDLKPRGLRLISERLHALMTEVLGYERYFVHGGDHGAVAADWLAFDRPDAIMGMHLNMLAWRHAGASYGSGETGATDATEAERAFVREEVERMEEESAYFKLQFTRPETIAYAMADSPIGQAAYILDKWWRWTDTRRRSFEEAIPRDDVLDNLMLYLATDSFPTSVWPYPGFATEPFGLPEGRTVDVPSAYSMFEDPLLPRPPRRFVERSHSRILQWRDHESGGHFPFLEAPDVLARDILDFARMVG